MIFNIDGSDLPLTWTPRNYGARAHPWYLCRRTADGKREDYTTQQGAYIRFKSRETAQRKAAILNEQDNAP